MQNESMSDDDRRLKTDLVWATVFLTVFALWGLSIIVGSQESALIPTAIALMIGGLFSLISMPLLLCGPGCSPTLLFVCRTLVWIEVVCLQVACVLGVIASV